jgi:GH35 family endo-1,4-beta-xylanase
MITELDVDDIGVPGPMIDDVVAGKYAEFIDLVGPFATLISFQALADSPNLPKRSDGLAPRPNLLDTNDQEKPSYKAVAKALEQMRGSTAS